MSDIWLRALVLIMVFAAVVFAVERLVSGIVGQRMKGRAINQRLDLIGKGHTRSEAMQMLRRRSSSVPDGLPSILAAEASTLVWLKKFGASFLRAAGRHHPRALGDEAAHCRGADSAGGAGDQRDPALEALCDSRLSGVLARRRHGAAP